MRHARALWLPAAFGAALLLGGCNGAHSTGTSLLPRTAPPNLLGGGFGFQYGADFVRQSRLVKPASFPSLGIDVIVKLQNPNGLLQYAAAVRDPKSAFYRRYLTPEQIADRFFATSADYAAAMKYLERFGLRVSGWKQRYMLHVVGTQQQLEQAFSTKFGVYQHAGETFFAPMTAPSVPKDVPIVGSENIVYRWKLYQPSMKKAQSNGLLSGYSPQQIQEAFDYIGAYNSGFTGNGATVGIIGTGPVSLQSSTHLGDLVAMRAIYHTIGTNTINLVPVSGTVGGQTWAPPPAVTATTSQCSDFPPVGGSNPDLPPSVSPTSTCNPEDGEAQIDTEQIGVLAPGATIDFYLGYTPNLVINGKPQGYSAQGLLVWQDEVQQAINDNIVDVLSISFGSDEQAAQMDNIIAMEQPAFAALEMEGVSVFASSGDNGAYACQDGLAPPQYENDLCVSYPATDQNVTAVGGVTTPLNSAGQLVGPMTAWGETTSGGLGGTGGGVSAYISMPSYQMVSGHPMDGMQPGSCPQTPCRNVPDVSLEADPNTGVATVMNADPTIGPAQIVGFGGTSVAAPEMAAMWALVKGAFGSRLNVAGPKIYPLYQTITGINPVYPSIFYDVLYGSNGQCYNATCPPPPPTFLPGQNSGVGYDLTTGIGVPFARALIKNVTNR
ncbi:MAG: S8/S53 family peptidase [Candidatus Eremiobacteraeota bacterium]|nr:S8/S53 family peptidase [Candidatus Eremiobacteraeota bacterium]